MNLGSHLRGNIGFPGRKHDAVSFRNVVCQWLFAIDGLLQLQRWQRCKGMGMFGGADNDGIDVSKLVHQFPKIRVTTCQCVSFCGFVDMRLIDVAQCCDMNGTAIV